MGKMFGVLVVKQKNSIRYLAAFSGKIDETTLIHGFIPPIYNTLDNSAFFKQGESQLNSLTKKIEELVNGSTLRNLKNEITELEANFQSSIQALKSTIRINKEKRAEIRSGPHLSDDRRKALEESSKQEQLTLKRQKKMHRLQVQQLNERVESIENEIIDLKKLRQDKSIALQQQLFDAYIISNFQQEQASVLSIFEQFSGEIPPAGTGECALPKLLHFAAAQALTPICFAEFWWGKSPIGEVRKHGMYYPACRAKCESLMHFLLRGVPTMKNPVLEQVPTNTPEIIFEDTVILVINKPSGMLSVPGRTAINSAEDLLKLRYPSLPYLKAVHRLDMGTSGILIFAKNAKAHANLQSQFQKCKVKKTYEAILDGVIAETTGNITLPLRLNTDHRPHQMVDFEHGKKAKTAFKIIAIKNGKTHIEFYPSTGRTHQLRLHASHPLGLNCPILGDELYGTSSDRLYLHAKEIEFQHPMLRKNINLKLNSIF
jgi:tRNA pseudouridine32 synthase/23S rRNA pseudouridine746 synthase